MKPAEATEAVEKRTRLTGFVVRMLSGGTPEHDWFLAALQSGRGD
jgi:hypothetical protein